MKSKVLFLSAALTLQVTQLSVALTEQRQQALVNQPITQTSENFYDRRSEGWYWYEDPEAKKKQKTVEVKEVRLSPNIDTNDLNTKVNNAKKFIGKGNKVKVTLRFRGREMAHVQSSKHILDDFAALLEDVAVVEKPAKMEGRSMSMVLTEKR